MSEPRVFYTFDDIKYRQKLDKSEKAQKKIASLTAILDNADGSKAVGLISFLGGDYFMIVVGADKKIWDDMQKAGLKPTQTSIVSGTVCAWSVPMEVGSAGPIRSGWKTLHPVAGFILNQIGPVRARARYPVLDILPSKSKLNGAMTCEQREALTRAAGYQVPFGN